MRTIPHRQSSRIQHPTLGKCDIDSRGIGRVDAWPGDALDDYWAVTLQLSDFGHERLLGPPSLVRSVRRVWVQPPTDYTGTWVTWHVNGQKASENQYANGRYDGTCVGFYNDGSRYIVQHFMDHVCDGAETGYYRSGENSTKAGINLASGSGPGGGGPRTGR